MANEMETNKETRLNEVREFIRKYNIDKPAIFMTSDGYLVSIIPDDFEFEKRKNYQLEIF